MTAEQTRTSGDVVGSRRGSRRTIPDAKDTFIDAGRLLGRRRTTRIDRHEEKKIYTDQFRRHVRLLCVCVDLWRTKRFVCDRRYFTRDGGRAKEFSIYVYVGPYSPFEQNKNSNHKLLACKIRGNTDKDEKKKFLFCSNGL